MLDTVNVRKEILKKLCNIHAETKLDLSYRYSFHGYADVTETVAMFIRRNSTVKELALRHCGITEKSAKHIFRALADNNTLEILNLEGNKIPSSSMDVLSTALMNNRTLKELGHTAFSTDKVNVAENGIGNAGAKACGEVLSTSRFLRCINFELAFIDDEGVGYIVDGMTRKEGLPLEELILTDNNFGREGAAALGRSGTGRRLKTLAMGVRDLVPDSPVGDVFLQELAAGMEAYTGVSSIEDLWLIGMKVSSVGVSALCKMLKSTKQKFQNPSFVEQQHWR